MSTEFLTIKEAAKRYSKAEITVRRMVREIVSEAEHKERAGVRPSPTESKKLKKKRKPFSYAISSDLLERTYGCAVEAANEKIKKEDRKEDADSIGALKSANDHLANQLGVKDQQIRALNQALEGFNDRQRETNILMKGLQERLLIEAPQKSKWAFWR